MKIVLPIYIAVLVTLFLPLSRIDQYKQCQTTQENISKGQKRTKLIEDSIDAQIKVYKFVYNGLPKDDPFRARLNDSIHDLNKSKQKNLSPEQIECSYLGI